MNYEYIKGNNYLNYYTIELDNDLYSIFFLYFLPHKFIPQCPAMRLNLS